MSSGFRPLSFIGRMTLERQNAVPALERANDPRKSVVKKIKKIGFVQDSFTETMGPAVAVGGRKRCPVIMPLVVPKAAKAQAASRPR